MCAVLLKQKNGYFYLESELFCRYGIRHFFSTIRQEGKENPVNFGFHYGEPREEILSNYDLAGTLVGVEKERMVKSVQIHEAEIHTVTEQDCGKGIVRDTDITNADGLLCGKAEIPLVIFSADCTPILLADKKHRAVCAVHAGWRGTAKEIAKHAVVAMQREFDVQPQDILCAVGPCISKCCFEVSEEVTEAFAKLFPIAAFTTKKETGKYHVDLKAINREILLRAGIPEENIEVSEHCTYCDEELFYSYRRQGQAAGRMAAFIVKPSERES